MDKDKDKECFRKMFKHIQPIKNDKVLLKKKPLPRRRSPVELEDRTEPTLSDHIENYVLPDDKLFFAREGVSAKQLRVLKQGKIAISANLDLHGHTCEEAREALLAFIEDAYTSNKRYISIVHGKGHSEQPVLKNKINHWLKQLNQVLAFCSALPRHGGTGAVYVLLKSKFKQ